MRKVVKIFKLPTWCFLILVVLFGHPGRTPALSATTPQAIIETSSSFNTFDTGDEPFTGISSSLAIAPNSNRVSRQPGRLSAPGASPAFHHFLEQVLDGQPGVIRGVYVENVLALRVVQQPDKDWKYVSEEWGTVTQFQSAARNGVIGLLAHNYLSGQSFFQLALGQEVIVVNGNGKLLRYRISDIQRYQKVDSKSLSSPLIDLQTGKELSVNQVFQRVYSGTDHVTFQTCIAKDGDSTWGLIFVIATPVE